jgi:hypothetical protein
VDGECLRQALTEAELSFVEDASAASFVVEHRRGDRPVRIAVLATPQGDVLLEVEAGRVHGGASEARAAVSLFLGALCREHTLVRAVEREVRDEVVHVLQAVAKSPPVPLELKSNIAALVTALDHSRDEVSELAEGHLAGTFLALRAASPVRSAKRGGPK